METVTKGLMILLVWGIALIGVATILPDQRWEQCPERLYPVRQFLAEKHLISAKFKKTPPELTQPSHSNSSSANEEICSVSTDASNFQTSPDSSALNKAESLALDAFDQEKSRSLAEFDQPLFNPDQTRVTLRSNEEFPSITNDQATALSPHTERSSSTSFTPLSVNSATGAPSNSEATSNNTNFSAVPSNSFNPSAPTNPNAPSVAINNANGTDLTAIASPGESSDENLTDAIPDFPTESVNNIGRADTLASLTFPITASPDSPNETMPNTTSANTTSANTTSANTTSANTTASSHNIVPGSADMEINNEALLQNNPIRSASGAIAVTNAQSALSPGSVPNLSDSLKDRINAAIQLNRETNRLSDAFLQLNQIRQENPLMGQEERQQINEGLDAMAFSIFYDTNQHILEPQYLVGENETLFSVAEKYQITPEHLAAINQISQSSDQPLTPGSLLKVVRGPVSAEVSMSRHELLLLFNGLYAGRFQLGFAKQAKELRGTFTLVRKISAPEYNGLLSNGQQGQIPGGDPNNPLGPFWLELNNGLGLQGTNQPQLIGTDTATQGGLIFSNQDITHLNILLPSGSTITLTD